ncbi:MAG: PmoA family protein [Aureliella sp.]
MPHPLPNCRIERTGDFEFSFLVRDAEVTRWRFSPLVPRPYFYPVVGPSGRSLTRLGHPGAPNHDHHRSLWFAHNDLMGQDFWSEGRPGRIVQKQWYAIEDGDELARIAFELHWLDGHDPQPLARQDVFVTLRPAGDEWSLEMQSDFRGDGQGVVFHKNNFGVLGLRVAKSLSIVFGQGAVTGSDGSVGEKALFGQPNRWVDYSGPIAPAPKDNSKSAGGTVFEGLTLIDHRDNPSHPVKWHVREDGWIGPSLSRDADVPLDPEKPLTVRYLLNVHRGGVDAEATGRLADQFDRWPALQVVKGTRPHHQWELQPRA